MNLVYFCIILLGNYVFSDDDIDLVKSRDVIIKLFRINNIKFKCKFSIFLSKTGEASLQLSKLACWPRHRRASVSSLQLRGRRGEYAASFTINPTRLRGL